MNSNASPIGTPSLDWYCCASANLARGDINCFARKPSTLAGERRNSLVDTTACNGQRKEHSSLLPLLAIALAVTLSAAAQNRERIDAGARDAGLLLNAAPQDGHLFLSWNAAPGTTYRVRSRPAGSHEWSVTNVGQRASYALAGLTNWITYEVELQSLSPRAYMRRSTVVRAKPRPRFGCAALRYISWDTRMNFFCSWQEMDAFLRRERIDPARLRCRNQPIGEWSEHAPDCLYQLPGRLALLLRSADERFDEPCGYREPEQVARVTRAILGWDDAAAPAALHPHTAFTGSVTSYDSVRGYRIDTRPGLASRVVWFTPRNPTPNRYAIYHEGHGGRAVDIAADTIEWLLARGWTVIALDMPLTGANATDLGALLGIHTDFYKLDEGGISPLVHFLSPVKAIVDEIVARASDDPDILLIGRSGGGWTTYVYGAIDPRVDAAIPVAGGTPLSQRLLAGPLEIGDFEQSWPPLFSIVRHEDLMIAAGSRGSLHLYNTWDPCCYRARPDDPFVRYLRDAGAVFGKKIDVFVDEENFQHSIGGSGYRKIDAFLRDVFANAPAPRAGAEVRKRILGASPCGAQRASAPAVRFDVNTFDK